MKIKIKSDFYYYKKWHNIKYIILMHTMFKFNKNNGIIPNIMTIKTLQRNISTTITS